MKFYHIQRLPLPINIAKWNKGQIIETNKLLPYNAYFEGILSSLKNGSKMKEPNGESTMAYGYKYFKQNDYRNTKNTKKFGLIGYQLAMQYQKWIREELFERVRLSDFPQLPSRKNSIWVTNKELVPNWNQQILRGQLTEETRIFEVSLDQDSNIHNADQYYVEIEAFSIEDIEERAQDYWKGNLSKNPMIEVIVEGKLTVNNIFKDINEWKKSI